MDELRMLCLEPDLVIYAGAEQRAGQEDTLLVALLKIELLYVRVVGAGLPLVYVKGDIEQGFPSARARLLLAAAWRAGLPDRHLIQLREEMRVRRGRVRQGEHASATYEMGEGTEQGRRRSPPL